MKVGFRPSATRKPRRFRSQTPALAASSRRSVILVQAKANLEEETGKIRLRRWTNLPLSIRQYLTSKRVQCPRSGHAIQGMGVGGNLETLESDPSQSVACGSAC